MKLHFNSIYLLSFLLLVSVIACKSKSQSVSQPSSTDIPKSSPPVFTPPNNDDFNFREQELYPDGDYCAIVKYSNGSNGTESYYNLAVVVSNGKLIKIEFQNGGWLDESHFVAPLVGTNGFAEFVNDKGYNYQVGIQHSGPCTSTERGYNSLPQRSQDYSYSEDDNGMSEEEREEKQIDKDEGVVVKRISGCDYFIIETRKGYTVAEWMGSYAPDEGDRIRGELNRYGVKEYYVVNRERTTRLYIEDFMMNEEDALELIGEKCN